jgi:hypothetical protein
MARTPAHLLPAGVLSQKDILWTEIRRQRRFSRYSLEDATRVEPKTIESALQGWLKAGFIAIVPDVSRLTARPDGRTEDGRYPGAIFELVRDIGAHAPQVNRAGEPVTAGGRQARMWSAMRHLREFDYREIAWHASIEGAEVRLESAQSYVSQLWRAGYFVRVRAATPGVPARYRMHPRGNTGPKAPMVQRGTKRVFDPNLGRPLMANTRDSAVLPAGPRLRAARPTPRVRGEA